MAVGADRDYDQYTIIIREITAARTIKPTYQTYFVAPVVYNYQRPRLDETIMEEISLLKDEDLLRYVLGDLSLDDRNILLASENYRLKTFLVNWPHKNSKLSGTNMAAAGFFAIGEDDTVQCTFCEGSLNGWDQTDDPLKEHIESFPFCPFVRGVECGNIPLVGERNSNRVSLRSRKRSTGTESATGRYDTGAGTSSSQYDSHSARLLTFSCWPTDFPIDQELVCSAGFYYGGMKDSVRCHKCGIDIEVWVIGDDPWVKHAIASPQCTFVIENKGWSFIERALAKQGTSIPDDGDDETGSDCVPVSQGSAIERGKSGATMKQDSGITRQSILLCSKCPERNRLALPASHVALPCGDLILCEDCNQGEIKMKRENPEYQPKCPKCRKDFAGTLHVFFS